MTVGAKPNEDKKKKRRQSQIPVGSDNGIYRSSLTKLQNELTETPDIIGALY